MSNFLETSILLKTMEGNEEEALELIGSLLPGERKRFRQTLGTLIDMVDEVIEQKHEDTPFTNSLREAIQGGRP